MSDGKYPIVKLIECIKLSSGKFLPTKKRISGKYNVYGGNGVSGNHNEYFVEKPTIVIGRVGEYCGCVHVSSAKAWITDNALYVTQFLKDFDNRYLCYSLNKENLNRLANVSGQPSVSQASILNTSIKVPPLDPQQLIADTLDKTQEIIDGHKNQLEELDNLIKATFYEMFGDPETNEKGWEVKPLLKCAEIVSGVTKGRNLSGKDIVNVPYMRVANIQDGYIDLSDIKTIDVLPTDIEKYKLQKGDLLLTEGGDPDKLGRGSVWYDEIDNCIHQNHIFRVRVQREILNPEYVSRLIGSSYGKRYFLKSAKQTTGIATINSQQLKGFPVLCPPIDLQNKFAQIVTNIEEQKTIVKQSVTESQNLFNSLMSEYFE